MLFQVRSGKVTTHKSQVSFPGGHIEAGETAVEAALRETREEIGAALGPIRVLGRCQEVPAVTGTIVTPVLAFVEQDVGDLQVGGWGKKGGREGNHGGAFPILQHSGPWSPTLLFPITTETAPLPLQGRGGGAFHAVPAPTFGPLAGGP